MDTGYVNDNELIAAWIRHEQKEHTAKDDPDLGAVEQLDEIIEADPQRAYTLVDRIAQQSDDKNVLASLGAGPIEDLLCQHGEAFIDRILERARSDPRWRFAFGCVWSGRIASEIVKHRVDDAIWKYYPDGTMMDQVQKARQFLAARMPEGIEKHPRLTQSFWSLLEKIKQDRDEALALAYSVLGSPKSSDRLLGVCLLGKIFNPTERNQRGQARQMITQLAALAEKEQHPAVLTQIGYALGKPYMRETLRPLVKLSRHPNADVRYAATGSIAAGISGRAPVYALTRLFELMGDSDPDVRNWATFAIGAQLDAEINDSEALRQALLDRVRDRHSETRAEAFRGLANHGDQRGIPLLKQWLDHQDKQGRAIWKWEVEAAGIYADPTFHSVLRSIAKWWKVDIECITWALKRCDPDPAVRAKTSRQIGIHPEAFDWHLHQNGVNIVYSSGESIIDLHNECQLTEMYTNHKELVLVFEKIHDYTLPSYFNIGDKLAVVIEGAELTELPLVQYPANFEGIYDLKQASCSLCIDDQIYHVGGKNFALLFIPVR